jgi:hypothetical protein
LRREFYHKASAFGLSGKITWPIQETIPVQPSCDLPPEGGFAQKRVVDFNFHDLISFKLARTHVSGSENDESHDGRTVRADNNLSVSVIEGFNLLDVVTVDRIVSRITTRRFHDSREIEIVLIGTRFEGFRISGIELDIVLDTDFYMENPTFAKVQSHLAGLKDARKYDTGETLVSIVKSITPRRHSSEFRIDGNTIEIPHIGRLVLAELLVGPNSKSLEMFRFKLGCPTGGDGSVGGGSGGGGMP